MTDELWPSLAPPSALILSDAHDLAYLDLYTALAGKASETRRKYIEWLVLFYAQVLQIEVKNAALTPIAPFVALVTPAAVEAWLGSYAAAGHSKSGLGQARAAIFFLARTLVLAKQAPSTLWHDLRLVRLPDNAASGAFGEAVGEKGHGRWLAPEEVRLLIESSKTHPNQNRAKRDASLIWLLVTLGLRRDEVASLHWDHLERRGANWAARIRGKRNKWRAVQVPPETIAALQPWAEALNGGVKAMPTGHILRRVWRSGKIDPNGITGNAVWRIVGDAWEQTGLIGDLAPHDLRRTAAAIALEAGATDREIQYMLGHSSIETTHRYLAPMRENTATYRIAQLIGGNTLWD